MSRIVVLVLMVSLLSAVIADDVEACVDPPMKKPDIWIVLGDGFALIIFHGYTTFGASPGQFCACALNPVAPIISVESVRIQRFAGSQVDQAFDFSPNANSDFGLGLTGFSSGVSGGVPTDQGVDIVFRVTIPADTTFDQLAAALSSVGNVIATDEADSNGFALNTHQAILAAGEIRDGTARIPLLSGLSLAFLVALLVVGGLYRLRR